MINARPWKQQVTGIFEGSCAETRLGFGAASGRWCSAGGLVRLCCCNTLNFALTEPFFRQECISGRTGLCAARLCSLCGHGGCWDASHSDAGRPLIFNSLRDFFYYYLYNLFTGGVRRLIPNLGPVAPIQCPTQAALAEELAATLRPAPPNITSGWCKTHMF